MLLLIRICDFSHATKGCEILKSRVGILGSAGWEGEISKVVEAGERCKRARLEGSERFKAGIETGDWWTGGEENYVDKMQKMQAIGVEEPQS